MNNIGDSIISSLGFTSEENFEAVKRGISGLQSHKLGNLPEPFIASMINRERLQDTFLDMRLKKNPKSHISYTPFEQAIILSIHEANRQLNIDLSAPNVLFIISTTKGNVHLIDENEKGFDKKQLYLWYSARLAAQFFGNQNIPVVVSNACISGGCAQITAQRALQSGKYDYAVVAGADLLCRFIVSGFQSFKALSPTPCKPFDKEHCGLNLGEAAATMIYCNEQILMNNEQLATHHKGRLLAGAIRNDACHISAPSRTGEGSFIALKTVLQNISNPISQIAFINAHGTATPYNDDMEMNAILRSGLEKIPVNSLKSYFGHTLGAAGLVETIISLQAANEGLILKTLGTENNEQITMNNEQYSIPICKENTKTDKPLFIKMLSGFGGTNAALLFEKSQIPSLTSHISNPTSQIPNLHTTHHCKITEPFTDLYRKMKIDYPKFFKMDRMSKAGFLAAEILLKDIENKKDTAILCFTHTSSLNTDKSYQKTIQKADDFFPSPSIFVYTLPNIVAGEIAIRHGCKAETSCYVIEKNDAKMMMEIVNQTFAYTPDLQQALVGYIDDDEQCEATMMLIERKGNKLFSADFLFNI